MPELAPAFAFQGRPNVLTYPALCLRGSVVISVTTSNASSKCYTRSITIKFELPQDVERELRERLGDLDQVAKEAFLVQSYRAGRLSVGQVARVLGKGVIEAQGWLSERGVPLNYSLPDSHDARPRVTLKYRAMAMVVSKASPACESRRRSESAKT